jgi:hypothetical protein
MTTKPENIEETIEQSIMTKVKNFFDLYKKLNYDYLYDFLDSISLAEVFGSDEEKQIIWNIFTKNSNEIKEIDYETCKVGMFELFEFYGITSSEENETKNDQSNYLSSSGMKEIYDSPTKSFIQNLRDSLGNKDKKLDELLTRISLRKSAEKHDKIPHYNTPFLDKDEIDNTNITDNVDESKNFAKNFQNNFSVNKPTHRRQITKTFTEIDIDKLQQLRKVFSLLDLRNKEHVYVSELQEVIRKYKFIKLTQDELINFLSLISDDLIQRKEDSNIAPVNNNLKKNSISGLLKLSINFELYSRAISVIEQQLLQKNSDTFTEKNDSYEITENYSEMIEELHSKELESVDYVMVLADTLKSIEYLNKNSIIENYEKILNKNFQANETKQNVLENIKEGVKYMSSKFKDMEIFLKEMNSMSTKKQNKLAYLKLIISKIENNLKNAEEDYRTLFQKFNSQQPVEIDEETELLIEENKYLKDQKILKDEEIGKLEKISDEKDEQIYDLMAKLEKSANVEKDLKANFNLLKSEYDSLKKNYDNLINDIYEKIKKEEEKNEKEQQMSNDKNSNLKNSGKKDSINLNTNTKSMSERDTIIKLRDKIKFNEENKKIFDMNYEQLILYTLNIENLNKQLEEKNSLKEKRIKDLEAEVAELTQTNSESSKALHLLKSENVRLHSKITEMTRDIEMNSIFRPSNVLGSRISRISVSNNNYSKDRKSDVSNQPVSNAGNRFTKMQKIFESSTDNTEVRISKMELEQVEAPRFKKKLTSVEEDFNSSQKDEGNLKQLPINSSNIVQNSNFNFNPNTNLQPQNSFKLDTRANNTIGSSNLEISLSNQNYLFSKKDSFMDEERNLFDEKGGTTTLLDQYYNDDQEGEIGENNFIFNQVSQENNFNYASSNISKSKILHSESKELEAKIHDTKIQNRESNLDLQIIDQNDDKEYIVDIIDDNPFGEKENDDRLSIREEKNTYDVGSPHGSSGMNDSVDLKAIARHSPFKIDLDLQKREKLKQLVRDNIAVNLHDSIKNQNLTKRNGKMPSLITEEILEEDINGEIIGSTLRSSNPRLSLQNHLEEKKGFHQRVDTIEDIGLVFNKDSQYMCYDFLTLRKTEAILKMFEENHEDVSSYEMFSDNIYLIDENNKKSKKYLFITSKKKKILVNFLKKF